MAADSDDQQEPDITAVPSGPDAAMCTKSWSEYPACNEAASAIVALGTSRPVSASMTCSVHEPSGAASERTARSKCADAWIGVGPGAGGDSTGPVLAGSGGTHVDHASAATSTSTTTSHAEALVARLRVVALVGRREVGTQEGSHDAAGCQASANWLPRADTDATPVELRKSRVSSCATLHRCGTARQAQEIR